MGIPKTVLSTRMTGSARETEGRIRALYQHHRRPAIALVVLAALAAALCGALVSCQTPPDSPFAFRVGGRWHELGTTADGLLGGDAEVTEDVAYDLAGQPIGRLLRYEDDGSTRLMYVYAPANGEWRLQSLDTADPSIRLAGGIGVGSTAEEVRAARPELEEDPDGFLFQIPVEFYRGGPLDAVCRLWTADGVVTELRLDLPSVQTEYEVGVSVGLAGTELMAIPCGLPRMEWGEAPQSDTGDSFSMEVEAAAGMPLPLNWGDAVEQTLLIYRWTDGENRLYRQMEAPEEVPGLEPGTYLLRLWFSLPQPDGLSYPCAVSYVLTVR